MLFISSSFVFISHLTNFLSYSVFMFVACFFCLTLPLRKNLARFENVRPFSFILHLYYRSFRLVSSLQQLILYCLKFDFKLLRILRRFIRSVRGGIVHVLCPKDMW